MADYGWATVTSTCPVTPADGDTESRIFGGDGDSIYRTVECPEGHTYGIKVVMAVTGTVTEYVLTEPE